MTTTPAPGGPQDRPHAETSPPTTTPDAAPGSAPDPASGAEARPTPPAAPGTEHVVAPPAPAPEPAPAAVPPGTGRTVRERVVARPWFALGLTAVLAAGLAGGTGFAIGHAVGDDDGPGLERTGGRWGDEGVRPGGPGGRPGEGWRGDREGDADAAPLPDADDAPSGT